MSFLGSGQSEWYRGGGVISFQGAKSTFQGAEQSLLVFLSSYIMPGQPITKLSSAQSGHSFFVSLT